MNDRSCGKLPVRLLIIKVEPELLQPTNPSSSFVLVFDYLFTEGGSTAAVLTLHTVVLARVGRRCQIVWQDPRFGSIAETGRYVTVNNLSTISCFLPCFLLLFIYFSVLIAECFSSPYCFVRAAVICSSSASSTWTSCVICILPRLRIPFVFVLALHFSWLSIFFVGVLCSRMRYVISVAFNLPTYLAIIFLFLSVSQPVTTEFVSIWDQESGRTLGVLLKNHMSLGRNNGFNVTMTTTKNKRNYEMGQNRNK